MAETPVLWDLTPGNAPSVEWVVRRTRPEIEGVLVERRNENACEVAWGLSGDRSVHPMTELAVNLAGKGRFSVLCGLVNGLRLKKINTPIWISDPDRQGSWCLADKRSQAVALRWQGQPGQSAAEALRSLCDAVEYGDYPPTRKGRPPGPPWKAITLRLKLPVIEALRRKGPTVTRAATDLLEAALSKETP